MEFFDKLGKTASKTYNAAAEKTSKLAKEAKLKLLMSEDKAKILDLYEEIGKKVYEKHIREQNIDIKSELIEECSQIDILADEIETARQDILNLKDKKQCENCYSEIEIECRYCPQCGAKQEPDTTQENEEVTDSELEEFDNELEDEDEDEEDEEIEE